MVKYFQNSICCAPNDSNEANEKTGWNGKKCNDP